MTELQNRHQENDKGKGAPAVEASGKEPGGGPFSGATLADMCRVSKGFPSNDCQVINTMTDSYVPANQFSADQRKVFENAVGSAIERNMSGLEALLKPENKEVAGAFTGMMKDLGYTVKTNVGQPGQEHFLTVLNNQTGNGLKLTRHDFLNGSGGGSLGAAHLEGKGKISYGGSVRPGINDLSARVKGSLDRE